jgi:CspA family cold shock protein
MQGQIKRLNEKKFGFIAPEDGGKDLFFHVNDLVDVEFNQLREGDAVSFDVKDTPKGPAAVNVQKI